MCISGNRRNDPDLADRTGTRYLDSCNNGFLDWRNPLALHMAPCIRYIIF